MLLHPRQNQRDFLSPPIRRQQADSVYKVLKAARGKLLTQKSSTDNRFKQARYGIKRLAKVEHTIQEKLKKQAKRYNKSYPGEMLHIDTKRLPLLKGQVATHRREYLFVAIDDFPENCTQPYCRTKQPTVPLNFCGKMSLPLAHT